MLSFVRFSDQHVFGFYKYKFVLVTHDLFANTKRRYKLREKERDRGSGSAFPVRGSAWPGVMRETELMSRFTCRTGLVETCLSLSPQSLPGGPPHSPGILHSRP